MNLIKAHYYFFLILHHFPVLEHIARELLDAVGDFDFLQTGAAFKGTAAD